MNDWLSRVLFDPDTDNAGGESAGGDASTGTEAAGATEGASQDEGAGSAEAEGVAEAEAGPSVIERIESAQRMIQELTGARAQGEQPKTTEAAEAVKGVLTDEALAEIAEDSPAAAKLLKQIDGHYAGKLAEAERKLAALEAASGTHSQVSEKYFEAQRNLAIDEIAKASGMGDLLGSTAKMSPDQRAMRQSIVDLATAVFRQAQAANRPISEMQAMETAAFAVAGRKGAVAQVQSAVVKRAAAHTVPPGQSRSRTVHQDPRKQAAATAGRGMAELRRLQNKQ